MSGGPVCLCGFKTLEEKINSWRVVHYHCNYSAFSGWRKTSSDYSAIECTQCGRAWRTKAGYVESLKTLEP